MSNHSAPRMTLCLAIDLHKSTAAGLRLSTKRLDRFNLALVNQLRPHLLAVGLENALIKFTGDGWLIISDDPEDAAPLCCLAIIMARQFQREMSSEAALEADTVPSLRLALCWGRDLPVELPNGQRDFVGDSVRHAVRACQFCHANEILIDDTVLRWVSHDFETARLSLKERQREFPLAKLEEELFLHVLQELKLESADDLDAPEYFVNTLAIIGRQGEAEELAERVATTLQSHAEEPGANEADLTDRFNRLLSSNLDYDTVSRLLRDMREAGLRPDISTFNALIAKAENYATRCRWLQRMKQEGIPPNIKTFNLLIEQSEDLTTIRKWLHRLRREGIKPDTHLLNTLMDRSPDKATACQFLEQMEAQGVTPNATTYDLLIEKSASFEEGRVWIERMFRDGIQPSIVSFKSLFSRRIETAGAEELLSWFLNLPYHPSEAMWQAIAEYRRAGKIEDALRLCLDYPYTQAAQKIFRAHPDRTLRYFEAIIGENENHANGAYALGLALMTLGRETEAGPWLRKALALASPGPRRDELARYLKQSLAARKGGDA